MGGMDSGYFQYLTVVIPVYRVFKLQASEVNLRDLGAFGLPFSAVHIRMVLSIQYKLEPPGKRGLS